MGIAEVVPQLDQCCCGCKLRTGSKFCGWCGAIFGIIGGVLYVLSAIAVSVAKDKGTDTGYTPEQLDTIKIVLIFMGIVSLVRAFFSILLLIGVYKEKVSYYLPWLIFSVVAVILDILLMIILLTQNERVTNTIGSIIGMFIYCYFILVVYSDYRQQRERGHGGN